MISNPLVTILKLLNFNTFPKCVISAMATIQRKITDAPKDTLSVRFGEGAVFSNTNDS